MTLIALVAVVVFEVAWGRNGLYRRSSFWLTMAIMWFFQIPVDGWLTSGDDPIVRYAEDDFSGIRLFFASPLEDFGFAFAMVSFTLTVWLRVGRARGEEPELEQEQEHDAQ